MVKNKRSKSQKKGKSGLSGISKLKQVILGIAIIIILTFFIHVGIRTFYKEPKYEDFCDFDKYERVAKPLLTDDCSFNQTLYDSANKNCEEGRLNPKYGSKGCIESYECDTCGVEYDKVQEKHSNVVFWISLILGITIFILSISLKAIAVSSGLMGGAVLTMFIGIVQDWRFLTDYARFAILGIALAILIWVGYKKLNK